MRINHLVMVDGEVMKPVCIRMPVKFGTLLDPSLHGLTCNHCQNKGWTKSLGAIGMPLEKDQLGRYISREVTVTNNTMSKL